MYSEAEIDSAVTAGAITAEAAAALRAHIAALRGSAAPADDEQFRLVTGFNDIFVTIACLLVIFAAATVFGGNRAGLSGLFVAIASWIMAEVFTRRRRMALPSIVLLLGFVLGVGVFAAGIADHFMPQHAVPHHVVWDGKDDFYNSYEYHPWQQALILAAAGLAATLGAVLHWRRFHVAITIAAGVAAGVLLALGLVAAAIDNQAATEHALPPLALICGIATFAFAMRWDLADPQRRTARADIAFWLHLTAAPLIAHPLFYWIGVTQGAIAVGGAFGVLAIYLLFALIALAVDRRALLVSALAYVLIALAELFRHYGAVGTDTALTALVIGSALLMLSALWAPARRLVLARLPAAWTARLPAPA
jgi:hypothetical protein